MEQTIGQQIREWRGLQGLTQAELAKLVGVGTDTIGRWERGEQEPKYSELEALVRFGVKLPQGESKP